MSHPRICKAYVDPAYGPTRLETRYLLTVTEEESGFPATFDLSAHAADKLVESFVGAICQTQARFGDDDEGAGVA